MNRRGFTLVEVLIVVIIIGILAAIGIPQFTRSIEKAKGGEARAGLGHIQTGEKVYFAENEAYTNNTLNLDITLSTKYWNFDVVNITSNGYTAVATRTGSGPTTGLDIKMESNGSLSGSWYNIYK